MIGFAVGLGMVTAGLTIGLTAPALSGGTLIAMLALCLAGVWLLARREGAGS